MKMISTVYGNCQLKEDDNGKIVGFFQDGKEVFRLNDTVLVSDDGCGYICPGIKKPGVGRIAEIREDDADYHFGVIMENGEFGYMKSNRIKKIS